MRIGLAVWSLVALGCGSNGAGVSPDAAVALPDAAVSVVIPDATPPTSAALPAGWLFTLPGANKIHVSDGNGGGAVWVGRGVNVDDLFLCGYDNTLWMPDPEAALTTIVTGLVDDWKPSFVRISLGMNSYPTVPSWLDDHFDAAKYRTPMTHVIEGLGARGVYVLVTLRSDASMIGEDTASSDGEATGLPSDGTTTPDPAAFPTGTDATYVALVDSFAHDGFVLFGLTNEPGGDRLTPATISAAMRHAVAVIRAEEDRLGVPHHLVSVQGTSWTSDIGFWADAPITTTDNVIYEVHGYPPPPITYTYANLPVIVGEYGSLGSGDMTAAFYADVEQKQIPNLAWDFEPYSNCSPDLVTVTHDATMLDPSSWGLTVQAYLLKHAP